MNQYELFKQLHHAAHPLLLPNAWNAKSAQLIEQAGFQAMGTSSGAIADSLGYPDGEKIPFQEMLYIIRRIKASTKLPLTVDFERGYSHDLQTLTDNIQQLADLGVSGINLEDAEGEDLYMKKLETINNHFIKTGHRLFINARTDVYLQKLAQPLETVLRRAARYEAAGADGLFIPGVADASIITAICSGTSLPVNIAVNPGQPSIQVLTDSRVKRISMAVFLYRATYHQLGKTVATIQKENSAGTLFPS